MDTNKRTGNETLSLKLPPEVAKIMPWIVAAKASGKPGHANWAKEEFERASTTAREREKWEQRLEERRRHYEWLDQLQREQDEADRQKRLEERRAEQALLDRLGAHLYCNEFGEQEFLPSHNSQKGWRRLLSEFPGLCDLKRYGKWGGKGYCSNERSRFVVRKGKWVKRKGKYNNGRKPRKPWFKKTRAQH